MNIKDILLKGFYRPFSITDIANSAGVSRTTIYNIIENPDSARISTLRKILRAMGFNLVISFERIGDGNDAESILDPSNLISR